MCVLCALHSAKFGAEWAFFGVCARQVHVLFAAFTRGVAFTVDGEHLEMELETGGDGWLAILYGALQYDGAERWGGGFYRQSFSVHICVIHMENY